MGGVTVSNIWKTFCRTGENLPRHTAARGQPKRLEEPELDLVQLLKKCRPSITYKDIKEYIEVYSIHGNSFDFFYRPSCPRLLTRRESDLEKMMRPAGEKILLLFGKQQILQLKYSNVANIKRQEYCSSHGSIISNSPVKHLYCGKRKSRSWLESHGDKHDKPKHFQKKRNSEICKVLGIRFVTRPALSLFLSC